MVTAGLPCPEDPVATCADASSKVVTGTNCILSASQGAAIQATGSTYVELFDCTAERSVYGIQVVSGATLITKGCTSSHNTHGIAVMNSIVLAESLTVQFCTHSGALVKGKSAETLFQDCSIIHNGGVALRAEERAVLTAQDCYIGWQGGTPEWHIYPTEGLNVTSGACVYAEGTEIVGTERFGMFVDDRASQAKLKDCLVQVHTAEAVPVAASSHGSVTLLKSTIHGGRCGVHMRQHASAILDRCVITRATREACIICLGSRLQLLMCQISNCGAGLVAVNARSSVFGFGGSISECGGTAVKCSTGAHADFHELASYHNVAGFEALKGGCMHLNSCSSCDGFMPFSALDNGTLQCVNCMVSQEVVPGMWY